MTLSYIIDTRTKNNLGEHPLKLRIIHNRTSAHISTGFHVIQKDWDKKNERLKSTSKSTDNTTRFNNLLISKKAKYFDAIAELEEEGKLEELSATQVKRKLLNQHVEIKDVFTFLEDQYKWLGKSGKYGTARTYRDLINKLSKFTNNQSLSFTDIDYKFLKDLEQHHLASGAQYSSLSIYLRTLRSAYNKAIKYGHVKSKFYPFDKYTIKNGEPKRRSLSEANFRKLLQAQFKEGSALQIGRDYYLASFYLQGMNWIDMCFLRYENFSDDLSRISYIRQKTGKAFNIKVSENLLKIISKYKPIDLTNREDFVFPVLNLDVRKEDQMKKISYRRLKINSYLRSISKELDIPSFSIYSARHTYATLLWNSSGSAAVAQQSLGHKTEKQTQEYLSYFGNDAVDSANDELFDQLGG